MHGLWFILLVTSLPWGFRVVCVVCSCYGCILLLDYIVAVFAVNIVGSIALAVIRNIYTSIKGKRVTKFSCLNSQYIFLPHLGPFQEETKYIQYLKVYMY